MGEPIVFEIPDDARLLSCMSCGKPIVFIVTKKGKRMPVEPIDRTHNGKPVKRGESHFAFCPHAAFHRRPR